MFTQFSALNFYTSPAKGATRARYVQGSNLLIERRNHETPEVLSQLA